MIRTILRGSCSIAAIMPSASVCLAPKFPKRNPNCIGRQMEIEGKGEVEQC